MRTRISGRVRALADVLAEGHVAALTGAGISAESGVPTFRDPDGPWAAFDLDRRGSWQGLEIEALLNPDALADLLAGLRTALASARPNRAHLALAEMDRAGLVEAVITQNVDSLHQDAGSREVVELHGSFRRLRCLSCRTVDTISGEQFVRVVSQMIPRLRSSFAPSLRAMLPRCVQCGGPSRPGVVTFGEPVEGLDRAEAIVRSCRTLLVVGTAGLVRPAADLPSQARAIGARIVEVSVGDPVFAPDLYLRGRASRTLGAVARALRPRWL